MGQFSKIEWTHHTFNPWWGCDRVSPACKHCYAETWARRVGRDLWGKTAPRRFMSDAYWREPVRWNAKAAEAGRRERVFCASMADVFEARQDLDAARERLWALIEATPQLDWLLLTKRPEHVARLVPWGKAWPGNVWLGTTAENQRWLDRRLRHLVEIEAAVRFLSCEPLLGPLDISPWGGRIDWVIAGGESGPRARPTNPAWFQGLRDQCKRHAIAFHFKQWGNWRPSDGHVNGYAARDLRQPAGGVITVVNVGKKAAGRLLDGRAWDGVPVARRASTGEGCHGAGGVIF